MGAIKKLRDALVRVFIPGPGKQVGMVAGTPYLVRDAADYDLPRGLAADDVDREEDDPLVVVVPAEQAAIPGGVPIRRSTALTGSLRLPPAARRPGSGRQQARSAGRAGPAAVAQGCLATIARRGWQDPRRNPPG